TVTPVSSSSNGSVTLTATISSPSCGSKTLTKEVWVGNPEDLSFDGIQGSPNISLNAVEQYQIPLEKVSSQYYTNYYWSVFPTDKLQIVSSHNYQSDVFIKGINEGFAQVRFHAINPCGSTTSTYFVHVRSSNFYSNYSVYPNPTSDVLNIKSKKEKDKIDKDSFYEIYSFEAKFIEKGLLGGNRSIDVSKYKKGRYILKIKVNGKTETHHIIIE